MLSRPCTKPFTRIHIDHPARQRNDEADIQYASGLLSYNNWELIVSDRVSNESQILSALKNAMDAETSWNRALGRALGE